MSNDKSMLSAVEFYDTAGQRNMVAFSSSTEAYEFIELGLKRWHFAGLQYHWFSIEEFIKEKMKTI